MFTTTADRILPTTVTGSWPRPTWFTAGLWGRALSDARIRESLPKATLARYRSDEYFATYASRYPNAAFVSRQLPVLYGNVRRLNSAGVYGRRRQEQPV